MNSSMTALALLATLCLDRAALAEPTGRESPPARGRTILLVDDQDVLYRSGTKRVLHPLKRHSKEPLVAEEKPWEVAIGWTSIYRDPVSGKFQLWYQAHSGKIARLKSHETVVCYAESKDGIHFVKPDLDLHSFNYVKKTNIVLVGNGGHGDRYGCSVLVDAAEKDPARRYKMAYYDWSKDGPREWPGLHVAFSPDGVHWTKSDKGTLSRTSYGGRGVPAPFTDEEPYKEAVGADKKVRKSWPLPLTMSDATDVFYDPVRSAYAIYGKVWLQGPDGGLAWKHAMGRIESKDFLQWSKPQLILTPDDLDPPHLEFHTSPVFYYQGRYVCLNQVLDRKAGGTLDIELMTSPDGLAWQRPFRNTPFLARGEAGKFDSGSIFTNSTPVVLDDEMRFYYGAYSQGAVGGGTRIEGKDQLSGVGLAIMPRDRFAGIRPVERSDQPTLRKPLENVGQVTLKPLDLRGCKEIVVNANASAGSVRVELLNEDGYRVRGFAREDAVPLKGDSLRHKVAWKDRGIEQLPPGAYSVRLHLDKAEVFAISFR